MPSENVRHFFGYNLLFNSVDAPKNEFNHFFKAKN